MVKIKRKINKLTVVNKKSFEAFFAHAKWRHHLVQRVLWRYHLVQRVLSSIGGLFAGILVAATGHLVITNLNLWEQKQLNPPINLVANNR